MRGLPEHLIEWNRVAALLGIDVPEGEDFDPVEAGLIPTPTTRRTPSRSTATTGPTADEHPRHLLLVLLLAYAVSGYWQGFITGAFATVGLLVGGLFGIWLAPTAARRRRPVGVGVAGGAVHRAALRVVRPGAAAVRRARGSGPGSPGSRCAPLDAVGGAALSVVAVLVVTWALGVAVSGARLPWVSEEVRDSAVLGGVERRDARPARCRRSARSTTSSARASSRATSSRSRRSGSSRSARRRPKIASRPGGRGGRGERAQDPRREQLRRRRRGHRLPLLARPGDDQRPRRGRRRRPRGSSSTTARSTPRSSTTTPTSTWRCSPSTASVAAPDLRPRGRGRRPGARCSATPRTARTTCRGPGSVPSSGCAAPTSTARAPSSARCTPCGRRSGPGNSGGPDGLTATARCSAWSSRRR